ncbi:MAG: DUF2064 domain-containing protein [Candidatus Dormibacteria bacterium]
MNTLVVFGRSPAPASGKTRLRSHVGDRAADDLYHAFFADIAGWQLPESTTLLLAVTEPLDGIAAVAPGADVHLQKNADFGDRIADAIDAAFVRGADRVVIVGTDAPTLPPESVAACFAGLRKRRATIVPATDGGWVALGVDRPIGEALDGVPWSTGRTCRATERALRRAGRRPLVLPPWYDVDEPGGLQQLRSELRTQRAAARAPRTAEVMDTGGPHTTAGAALAWLDRRGSLLIGIVIALMTFTFNAVRFYSLHTPAYDLGFFDQVAWNTVHGQVFLTTFLPYAFLGEHWEPLFGVFAQLYRIVASPIWLLLIQAAAFGLAPLAAARLARLWLPGRPHAPLVAALVMALSPLLTNAAPYGFHTEAVTPALALFALEAAATRRRLRFVLLLLLLATVKEDALLVAAGTGWIAWRVDGERLGLLATGAGIAGFVVVVLFVMPFFRGGMPSDLADAYAWLSPGSTSVGTDLHAALAHPLTVLTHLVDPAVLRGWALAFLPLALLPLLSGWALLGALLPLLVALMSGHAWQSGLQLQYGLESAPLLVACAMLGWRRIRPLPQLLRAAPPALVGASAAAYALMAVLPGSQFATSELGGLSRYPGAQSVLDRIPANVALAASTGLVAHVSERTEIWEFPAGLGVPYVVLDERGSISDKSVGYQKARRALADWHYHEVASAEGVTLWKL